MGLRRTRSLLLKARGDVITLPISEKGPAANKAGAGGEHNEAHYKLQPLKMRRNGIITEIGEVHKDGILHF